MERTFWSSSKGIQLGLLGLIVSGVLAWTPSQAINPPDSRPHTIQFIDAEQTGTLTIRMPFRLVGHLIVIRGQVNGQSGSLILDTGAEGLVLNSSHIRQGIRPDHLVATGMTGMADRLGTYQPDSVLLSDMIFRRVTADVVDLSHLESTRQIPILGLIGYRLLAEYEVFIDFYLQQITLTRLDEQGFRLDSLAILETPSDSLAVRRKGHILILEGYVKDHRLTFGLDTGAEVNMIDRRVKRRVFDHFELIKRVRLHGAGHRTVEVMAGRLFRVRLGHIYCPPMNTLLTSLDEFSKSFGTNIDGVLGYEFLVDRRVAINYQREMLFFYDIPRP